jgi:hypothetical protein
MCIPEQPDGARCLAGPFAMLLPAPHTATQRQALIAGDNST